MNVALYGPARDAWSFTERGGTDVRRYRSALVIGPSSMEWQDDTFTVHFEEATAPLPGRVSGTVRIHPLALADASFVLDTNGRHRWAPIAPIARAEVDIRRPASARWTGMAYVDSNFGSEPLEDGFSGWNWGRATTRRRTVVTYDSVRRDGTRDLIQHSFDADGRAEPLEPLAPTRAPRTLWGMERIVRVDPGTSPRVVRTLEDTPFYARSQLSGRYLGEDAHGVHEALSLDRFRTPAVQFMLPYRMRRASP
ncbi:carotenoid 1,2-hydratase [Polyangium sp. 6x1]|uniref:carotenoid 1,2-hydratase n=1 Tax=Polyangium sp. 6x1 TaxID=3042689 RepID=UPI0024822850|nr:carotenoid 1,2-hydratase [Polyangium sp. 6x1]MDI1450678.1 carotenoid 1,2-hydratase [Polyangium sp. 6x1]